MDLSKKDKLWKDAADTAADSQNTELAEALLQFFVENDNRESFAAALLTCYDVVRPDVALELAWRHKIIDFVMPYLIQVLREYIPKIDSVEKQIREAEEKKANTPGNFTGEAIPVSVGGFPVGGFPVGGLPPTGLPSSFQGFQQNF